MPKKTRTVVEVFDVPDHPEDGVMYKVLPKNYSSEFFALRTDREIGNRTREEIDLVAKLVTLQAGAGGMGGLMLLTGHRGGFTTTYVVDPGYFDGTNSNRQAASTKNTEGKNKAFETVRMARDISPDTTYFIITESLTEEVWDILRKRGDAPHLMYDEIELFEAEPRLTLHAIAKTFRIPVINCNTVFYRTYFFMFDYSDPKNKMDLSSFVAASLGKSTAFVESWRMRKQRNETVNAEDEKMEKAMVRVLIPEVPEYSRDPRMFSTVRNWHERLDGHTVIVTATNPPGAASFAMSQGMLYLLNKHSKRRRDSVSYPRRGYLVIDFAKAKARTVIGRWYCEISFVERLARSIVNRLLNVFR